MRRHGPPWRFPEGIGSGPGRRWRARGGRGRHGPPPFVRRMGCAFAGLILLAAVGAGTLASLLLRAPQRGLSILVVAIGVAVALSAGFAIVLRGTARFFGRQDRLRRQLLADVAHELRTPLAILQGRIEGLIDGVYARDEESLRGLLDETRHLGRLVDDLGTLASAESGALDLRKEPVDLADLARDAAASFARPIAVGAPEDMPPIDVDPVRIREVLLNLLGNALDSTPEDGEVAVRIEPLAGRVVVRVIDTGRGIPAEELPRVFDRFRKGAGSRGSGLGLAIARDLVRAHGGRIAIESTPGRGTTVTVELPA